MFRSLKSAALALVLPMAASMSQAETYKLRIGSGHPVGATVYVTELHEFFVPESIRRVKERTGHDLQFTEAYGGSVAKVNETLQAVESGLLDIGGYCMCFEQSRLATFNFPYWTPFGPRSAVTAVRATRKVYDEFPQLAETFEKKHGQKLLAISGYDDYNLGTTFAWESLSDLKGRKIGAAGPNLPWLQGSGAVGVSSSLPDGYNGLKSGIYSGWIMFPSAYSSFKFYEPAPHYKLVQFGSVMVNAITINLRTWKRLPPQVQAVLSEVAREYELRQAQSLDASNQAGLQSLQQVAKVSILSDKDRAQWAEGLKAWPGSMAREARRSGLPATAILRSYIRHLEAEGHSFPVAYPVTD